MKTLLGLFLAGLLFLLGCAPGAYREYIPRYVEEPAPGVVPPSFYDYDPAYRHWFEPWYVNPYQQ